MSNKPPKHSELKKKETTAKRMRGSWGKPRTVAPSIRIRPERFLIVTEGTRTEPLYFEGFRRRINAAFRGEYVTLRVYGVGANTVSLFDQAKRIAEANPDGFTQVWIVYDKDSFPAHDFNVVVDLCASASGESVTTVPRGRTRRLSCGTSYTLRSPIPRWEETRTNPFLRGVCARMEKTIMPRTALTCSIFSRVACPRR
mgnify:CR=1 FL=1